MTTLAQATQAPVEFLQIGQKPHLGATVRFVHKRFEHVRLCHVPGVIAQDHEVSPVHYEFLEAHRF
jgi:hypothetical protein